MTSLCRLVVNSRKAWGKPRAEERNVQKILKIEAREEEIAFRSLR